MEEMTYQELLEENQKQAVQIMELEEQLENLKETYQSHVSYLNNEIGGLLYELGEDNA